MTSDQHSTSEPATVEMPRTTVAPLVVALGISLLAAGLATSLAFLVCGAVLLVVGLGIWIGQLLPGRGHVHEPLVPTELRPKPVAASIGTVEQLRAGMPGHRLRVPERVHPISAGLKGGALGGLVMPLPAMAYGLLSGQGIWLPLNLLAGMVLPGIGEIDLRDLQQFQPTWTVVGVTIHVTVSLSFGLIYGVLLPTLPAIGKPVAWGALLMPLLWTAVSFAVLGFISPIVRGRIDWPWFVVSQFIFGMIAAFVVARSTRRRPVAAGVWGGAVGGLLMPIPAMLWGYFSGHGMWYPVNLLSGVLIRHADELPATAFEQFRADWFWAAVAVHAALSLSFGLLFGLLLPNLPAIPPPLAWGGLLMPLLWTATSYGLMGVVNPILQQRVDWPWFVVSQFVYGLVAAIVVLRSEQIYIPPAGPGRSADGSASTTGSAS